LSEEAWTRIGGTGFCAQAPWPVADAALLKDASIIIPVQVNGKRRGELHVAKGTDKAQLEALALALACEAAAPFLKDQIVAKVIVVPDRIINIVTG
jgi:leucyl-tRNA synthetase